MLCATALPLRAEVVPTTIPSTTAHNFSKRPMIAGTVATVNDHQLVIDTEQGQRITLQVDSRTMAPRDLAPGMTVRTEFAALENCRFHADRVIAVRPGMSSERMQAYAQTAWSREHHASNGSAIRHADMQDRHRMDYTSTPDRRIQPPSGGAIMTAAPGTADHHYSTRPLISGIVLSVNDHRLVVKTDQGHSVAMVMDSRTLVPREIAPGSLLRAEFKEMQDGRYYAKRVHVIDGSTEYREQAYANTFDNDVAGAGVMGDCGNVVPTPGHSTVSMAAHQPSSADRTYTTDRARVRDRSGNTDQGMESNRNLEGSIDSSRVLPPEERVDERTRDEQLRDERARDERLRDERNRLESGRDESNDEGRLPDSAGERPLLVILGLIALGSAGVITLLRRRAA